jgi:hypothetical protein
VIGEQLRVLAEEVGWIMAASRLSFEASGIPSIARR